MNFKALDWPSIVVAVGLAIVIHMFFKKLL